MNLMGHDDVIEAVDFCSVCDLYWWETFPTAWEASWGSRVELRQPYWLRYIYILKK